MGEKYILKSPRFGGFRGLLLDSNDKIISVISNAGLFNIAWFTATSESTDFLQKYGGKTVKRLWVCVSRPPVVINRGSSNLDRNEIHSQLNNCLL